MLSLQGPSFACLHCRGILTWRLWHYRLYVHFVLEKGMVLLLTPLCDSLLYKTVFLHALLRSVLYTGFCHYNNQSSLCLSFRDEGCFWGAQLRWALLR